MIADSIEHDTDLASLTHSDSMDPNAPYKPSQEKAGVCDMHLQLRRPALSESASENVSF